MNGSSCALCRLRLPGSKEYFLWLQRMRTLCSLMILKKVLQGNLLLSRRSSPTSRQPAQLCPLVDRAAAAEERQRTAEKAVPRCDLCKSGNTSSHADLFASCYMSVNWEKLIFIFFILFSDVLWPRGKSALWNSDVLFCFFHSTITFADIFLLQELKLL